MTVTRDATSGKYCPANLSEWTTLLAGTGISNPTHLWLMQDAGAPYADAIGSITLADEGSRHDNQVTITGWSRFGQRSRGDGFVSTNAGLPDPTTTSQMIFAWAISETPGTSQSTSSNMYMNQGAGPIWQMAATGNDQLVATGGGTTVGTPTITHNVKPILLQRSRAESVDRLLHDQEMLEVANGSPTLKGVGFAGNLVANGSVTYLYCAEWEGTDAELTPGQLVLLRDVLLNGPLAGRGVVTRDTTSGQWMPANEGEYALLLSGTGINPPMCLWQCQEASSNAEDSNALHVLTSFSSPGYQQAVAGWTRKALECHDVAACFYNINEGIGDIDATSHLLFAYVAVSAAPGTDYKVMWLGEGGVDIRSVRIATSDLFEAVGQPPQANSTGTHTAGTSVHPIILQLDRTNSAFVVQTDQETIAPVYSAPSGAASYLGLGPDAVGDGTPVYYLFAALFRYGDAELDATHRAILIDRHVNGPAVTSIAVTPSPVTLSTIGATQQLTATATRADGSTYDATATASWSSSAPGVATVSSSGLVTAIAAGTATITASFTSLGATAASGTSACTVSGVVPPTPTPVAPVVVVNGRDHVAEALARLCEQFRGDS